MAGSVPGKSALKLLSVVIPARDEAGCIEGTLRDLHRVLSGEGIAHELVVVDDGSTDATWTILEGLREQIVELTPVRNAGLNGIGRAIARGLEQYLGDAVVIYMADASDAPEDVVRYWEQLQAGYDCVFGSRFLKDSEVVDYPKVKLAVNRLANLFIRVLFHHGLNDTTNAFKAYRREVIDGCRPILSPHFNITVELPLKAIIRGYSYTIIPIRWQNRRTGQSKLKIKEMGSRYFFIVMYLWLEKYFSRGDYTKKMQEREISLKANQPRLRAGENSDQGS